MIQLVHTTGRSASTARTALVAACAIATLGAQIGGARPALAAASDRSPHRPPLPVNLLLITLDTTRADHLGCYGDRSASTPRLDALARSGALFENALSPAPLTLPSHSSIMTGLVPRRHGVRDNAVFRLDPAIPTLASILAARGYATAGVVGAAVLDRATGIGRGFASFDDQVRIRKRSEFNFEERAAAQVTDAALDRLASLAPPFALWVHYYDPHFPYVPPSPFAERFRSSPYDGELAYVDSQIARLLTALDRSGRAGSTLIIVAGDHGESLGDHGENRHDLFVYQSTQHVPLILAGPGVARGRRIVRTAGLVDLLPTILDLLGAPSRPGLDGASLAPLVAAAGSSPGAGARRDESDSGAARTPSGAGHGRAKTRASANRAPAHDRGGEASRAYEMESFFPGFAYGWAPPIALVSDGWKFIALPRPELYDLRSDPRETRDLLEGLPASATPVGAARASDGAKQPVPRSDSVRRAGRMAADLMARYRTDAVARGFGAPSCSQALSRECPSAQSAASAGASTGVATGGKRPPDASDADDGEDAERAEKLAALGYVGGTVRPGATPRAGPLRDPKEGAAIVRTLERARAKLQSGDFAEALGLLAPIAREEPSNLPVLESFAAATLASADLAGAVEIDRRVVELRGDDALPHANLAGALRAQAASLDGATPGVPSPHPVDPRAAELRDQAAAEFERALALRSRDSETYLAFAQLELERARPGEAREILMRADRAQAGDPDLYLLLGAVQASLGDAAAARSAFDRALALDPRSVEAHEGLGRLDFASGNARSAEAHYAAALQLVPSAATARTLGAIRLEALSDRAGAREAFQRALQLDPSGPQADDVRAILEELSSAP